MTIMIVSLFSHCASFSVYIKPIPFRFVTNFLPYNSSLILVRNPNGQLRQHIVLDHQNMLLVIQEILYRRIR